MKSKFYFICKICNKTIHSFSEWFSYNQQCPECSSKLIDVHYNTDKEILKSLLKNKEEIKSLWHYFDFLPLNDKNNIVTRNEGSLPVDRWTFLEEYAKKRYNINCKVFAYRNDLNSTTGTFKDIAGTLAASVLKEHGIKEYVVASTGNTANAFAHYLAAANISLSVFMPEDALKANESEVNIYGQRVFKVKGDYNQAKIVAARYAKKHNILISNGNIDPLRVEAKKTWVYEWVRLMDEFPTVYIQALSGGTGQIAVDKACDEMIDLGLIKQKPRFISAQPDKCAPMAHAWETAKAANFPQGWEMQYPVYDNPPTMVQTLANGNPTTFPIIGKLTKANNGEILEVKENKLIDIARLIAYETTVRIGPASAVTVSGFFESLNKKIIKENDVVLINIGEGVRRTPDFMEQMIYTTMEVSDVDECPRFNREEFRKKLWDAI